MMKKEIIFVNKEEQRIKKDLKLAIILFGILIISYILSAILLEVFIPNEYMYVVESMFPYITFAYVIGVCLGAFVILFLVYLLLTKPYKDDKSIKNLEDG